MNYKYSMNNNMGIQDATGVNLPKQTYFKSRHLTLNHVKQKGSKLTKDGYFGDRNLLNYVNHQTKNSYVSAKSDASSQNAMSQSIIMPNELRLQNNKQSDEEIHNRSMERFNKPAFAQPDFKVKANATSNSMNVVHKATYKMPSLNLVGKESESGSRITAKTQANKEDHIGMIRIQDSY